MRRVHGLLIANALFAFGGCNAILGNESDYRLVTDAGSDASMGGTGGSSGTSGVGGTSAAGGTAGVGGTAGSAGASGSAGSSGSAGIGGTAPTDGGAGKGGSAGTGGTAGSAGKGGSAGTGGTYPCGDGGAEDCYNNIDDDCNGKADCADPACTTPANCVPEAGTASLGTFLPPGASCPAGFSPRAVRRTPDGGYQCAGCSCVSPVSYCRTAGYGTGANGCSTTYNIGKFFDTLGSGCGNLGPEDYDTNFYLFESVGISTCTPAGTPQLPAASWAETRTFCIANRVGGGCTAGNRCVPKVTTTKCSIAVGATACGSGYPTSSGATWYTGQSDTRTCAACTCTQGSAACAGGTVTGYTGYGCSGTAVTMSNGSAGAVCGVPQIMSVTVAGQSAEPGCPPQSYISGALTGTGPQTICCR